MTEIYLGFASSRLYEKGGELHYDMWPALGTQMMLPVRGAISGKRVVRNTDEELILEKGVLRYTFRFSPRQTGPDVLRYSVRLFGVVPLGTCRGDISSDGKRALRAAYGGQCE